MNERWERLKELLRAYEIEGDDTIFQDLNDSGFFERYLFSDFDDENGKIIVSHFTDNSEACIWIEGNCDYENTKNYFGNLDIVRSLPSEKSAIYPIIERGQKYSEFDLEESVQQMIEDYCSRGNLDVVTYAHERADEMVQKLHPDSESQGEIMYQDFYSHFKMLGIAENGIAKTLSHYLEQVFPGFKIILSGTLTPKSEGDYSTTVCLEYPGKKDNPVNFRGEFQEISPEYLSDFDVFFE
jgi:hypothetical protein